MLPFIEDIAFGSNNSPTRPKERVTRESESTRISEGQLPVLIAVHSGLDE